MKLQSLCLKEKVGRFAERWKESCRFSSTTMLQYLQLLLLIALKLASICWLLDYFHSLTFFLNSSQYRKTVHFIQPLIGAPIFFYIGHGLFTMLAPRYLLSRDLVTTIVHPLKAISGYYIFRAVVVFLKF
jgi:hypothetical protein